MLLQQPRGQFCRKLSGQGELSAIIAIQGDRNRWNASDHCLHGCRNRPGIGDVVPDVCPLVDARDDQGRRALEDTQQGQGDAISRRAAGRQSRCAISQPGRRNAKRLVHCLGVT